MAHEHAIEFLKAAFEEDKDCSINYQLLAEESYLYADAMQAESDKRKPKGLPEALFDPDWSQAKLRVHRHAAFGRPVTPIDRYGCHG